MQFNQYAWVWGADQPRIPVKSAIASVLLIFCVLCSSHSLADECPSNWKTLHPEWIWCDDFEADKLSSYFEVSGPISRSSGIGYDNSFGMRATWSSGATDGGSLQLAIGLTPSGSGFDQPVGVSTTTKYREVYYRVYLKSQTGWINPPNTSNSNSKVTRAMVVTASNWAQAMISHIWSDEGNNNFLLDDPTSCVTGSSVQCTEYNDFAHLRFLGATRGTTSVFSAPNVGNWNCIEHHVKLNDAGLSNGVSEFWVDGHLEASRSNLNFVGSYDAFGINGIFFENYINNGSPQSQSRYWDNIVVSTERVGCSVSAAIPPPNNLRVR